MAYIMDEYERRKKMQEQYRQAVERRLTTDDKQRGKKPADQSVLEALRRRKNTGYFGGM